jgi:PhnO protein
MKKVVISKATINDLDFFYDSICKLEETSFEKGTFSSFFLENITKKNILYGLATVEGKKVGLGTIHIQKLLHHCRNIAEIQELFIDKNMRGYGIGKELVAYLENFAKEQNCETVEVVSNKRRKDAHRFYLRENYINSHEKFVKYL